MINEGEWSLNVFHLILESYRQIPDTGYLYHVLPHTAINTPSSTQHSMNADNEY